MEDSGKKNYNTPVATVDFIISQIIQIKIRYFLFKLEIFLR